MRIRYILLVSFLLLHGIVFGQSKRELLEYGDFAFKKGNYASAVYFYSRLLDRSISAYKDVTFPYQIKSYHGSKKVKKEKLDSVVFDTLQLPKDTLLQTVESVEEVENKETEKNIIKYIKYEYVVHQLAESYRLSHDYANAEVWYAISLKNPSDQYPDQKYWYAVALMKNEKYKQALYEFESILKEAYTDSTIHKQTLAKISNCNFAMKSNTIKKGIIVNELNSILNSGSTSFAANYYGDDRTLVFASARLGSTADEEDEYNGYYLNDLYLTTKTDSGWREPEKIGGPINTLDHEESGVLNGNKTSFYFTRCSAEKREECAIYVSKWFNNQWMLPMKLNENVNQEGFMSMHPALSEDGKIIYFASDRPGGYGKMDLWYCTVDQYGNTSIPINFGPKINTAENEISPYYHYYTKTLYFSSDGHVGMGGFDNFSSHQINDTIWSNPTNLGAPINSSRDDYSYVLAQGQQEHAYFSSDRKDCAECIGGNCFRIFSMEKPGNRFIVSGMTFNAFNDLPLANVTLTIKDVKGVFEPYKITTDEEGMFILPMEQDMHVFIKAQKLEYFADAAAVSTIGLKKSKELMQDFYLSPIPGTEIEIPGIEYDYDKATLRPKSKRILDKFLVDFLKLNDNIVIDIRSHTDDRGTDEYNMKLSEKRAKFVVNYLIERNIAPDRLIYKGYGESRLLVPNAQTEEDHQKNRRTSFSVLSEDYSAPTK